MIDLTREGERHDAEQEQRDRVETRSHLSEQVTVINHGDSFGVFDLRGDFPRRANGGAYGLFFRGTRFLNAFELYLHGRRPLLLSSELKDKNEILTVNVTNDNLYRDGTLILEKASILVARAKFLLEGVYYERIVLENFGSTPHRLEVSFAYGADFADIFEVRGVGRARRGKYLGFERQTDQAFGFSYLGLDQVLRSVHLHFSRPPASADAHGCAFEIDLLPKARETLYLEVECRVQGVEKDARLGFEAAQRAVLQQFDRHRALLPAISTENTEFNHWLTRSVADFISLLVETDAGLYPYAGVPWYNTIFGRDGLITALLTLWCAPALAKGVLTFLARTQAEETNAQKECEPGKIVHEMRTGEMANLGEVPFQRYFGTVDATPLFAWLAGEYFRRTNDRETLEGLWPHVMAALRWIDTYGDGDGDGFVEYQRKQEGGLFNQGWKDSHDAISHADGTLAEPPIALVEVQGYVYAAKRSIAEVARVLGHGEVERRLLEQAADLKRRFNERFWDEELGSFCLALDGRKRCCRVLSTNPAHCLFSGIVDADKAAPLARTLLSEAMFSGWGLRTLAKGSQRYNPMSYHNGSIWPHDNAVVALGLSRYGMNRQALRILEVMFEAARRLEGARLPELFCGLDREEGSGPTRYPVACSPQAWSVASLFGLLQAVLGLEINAVYRRIELSEPIIPCSFGRLAISDLEVPGGTVFMEFRCSPDDVGVNIPRKPAGWSVQIRK